MKVLKDKGVRTISKSICKPENDCYTWDLKCSAKAPVVKGLVPKAVLLEDVTFKRWGPGRELQVFGDVTLEGIVRLQPLSPLFFCFLAIR
jgi:hypothetical protein